MRTKEDLELLDELLEEKRRELVGADRKVDEYARMAEVNEGRARAEIAKRPKGSRKQYAEPKEAGFARGYWTAYKKYDRLAKTLRLEIAALEAFREATS
jgi:hypothetical protein